MGLLALRPGNSLTILIDGFVNRLQELSFLPSCYSSYGAWTLTPVGLAPTDHASLRWTHTFEELSTWMSDLAILRKLRFGYNFVPKRRLEAALESQNPRKHA